MTNGRKIRKALQSHAPKRRWIPLAEVFTIVEKHMPLDAEDLAQAGGRSRKPRWKTNVRRLPRGQEHAGTIRTRKSKTTDQSDHREG